MKYRFVRKAKALSSEEIRAKMNFEELSRHDSEANHDSSSAFHKNWSLPKRSTFISTAAAILILITAGPALLKSEISPFKRWYTPKVEKPTPEVSAEEPIEVAREEVEVIQKPKKKAPIKKEQPVVVEPMEVEEPVENKIIVEAEEPIKNEDVLIRAAPVPNLNVFLSTIDNELEYPKNRIEDEVEGFVRVFFKVNKEGKPEDFKVTKSLGKDFDNEAIRVLKLQQDWEPARFNGQAVDSYFTIKISFAMEEAGEGDSSKQN